MTKNSRMNSTHLRLFFLATLLGGLLVFSGCSGTGETPLQQERGAWRDADEDVRVEGIHFREWMKGRLLWDLDARTATYYHEDEKVFFQQVGVVYHPPEGGQSVTLRADHACYETGRRRLQAEGNVQGAGAQGFRFRADSLSYDLESKNVKSPGKVLLEKDRLTVEGIGMEGSLADQTFVLLSSVRTVFDPPPVVR